MRVVVPDLRDRIEVRVDPDADAVDWDTVVARFLLRYVRSQQATRSAGTAEAEVDPERHSRKWQAKTEVH